MELRDTEPDQSSLSSEENSVLRSTSARQDIEQLPEAIQLDDDPLWDIVALGNSGLGDLALEHDRYLAEDLANSL